MTTISYYCTADDVRRQMGIGSSDISDADCVEFIKMAQSEVDALTHTTFLKLQDSGTATAGDTTTVTDSGASWVADEWNAEADLTGGYMVWIIAGTNSGEARTITDNTTTALTVSPAFTAAIDATSDYRIVKNTYTNETFTGDDTQVYYTKQYPLIVNPYSVTIDGNSVTIGGTSLYTTAQWGKLELGSSAEQTFWTMNYPLLCNVKYYYGAYLSPAVDYTEQVRDLCAVLAGIMAAVNMIGGTYTFATGYSVPDMSVQKGVPYPHFNTALSAMTNKRDWLMAQINNKIVRPMFA